MKANGIRIFYLECDLAETPRMRSLADESNKDVRYYTSERDDARVPHWSWCGSQAVALPPRDHASTVWGRPGAPKRVHEPTYALCACPGPCPSRGRLEQALTSCVLFEDSTTVSSSSQATRAQNVAKCCRVKWSSSLALALLLGGGHGVGVGLGLAGGGLGLALLRSSASSRAVAFAAL